MSHNERNNGEKKSDQEDHGSKRERSDNCDTGAKSSSTKSLPILLNGQFGNPKYSVSPSSSPPNKKSADEMNMQLAHEIAMSDSFDLSKKKNPVQAVSSSPQDKFLFALKTEMKKAFWDCLADDLNSQPPDYKRIFVILEDLRNMLIDLLPKNRVTTLHKKVAEVLDLDLLRQQAEHDALNVKTVSTQVIDLMSSMCAPVQDDNVANLRKIDNTVELLREIFVVLELMKKDEVNFLISSVRPYIQENHMKYEQEKFSQFLKTLPDGPVLTKQWLSNALESVKDNSETPSDEAKPKHSKILKEAYLQLLDWKFSYNSFPEMVQMDKDRYAKLQMDYYQLIWVTSVLLTGISTLSAQLSSHSMFIRKLKNSLLVLTDKMSADEIRGKANNFVEQIWKEAKEYLQQNPYLSSLPDEKKTVLNEQIAALCQSQQHPIFKIISKRIREYIATLSDVVASGPKNGAINPPSIPSALKIVENELLQISMIYVKLTNLNQKVYGLFYEKILKEMTSV